MSEPISDEAMFVAFGHELVAAAGASVAQWVEGQLTLRFGGAIPDAYRESANNAAAVATSRVIAGLSELVATDIDQQRTTPLSVIRQAGAPTSAVLAAAGVPAARRDPDSVRLYPDDVYDLTIGSYADLSDDLQQAGIKWGAAKAHIHLARRRAEGQR